VSSDPQVHPSPLALTRVPGCIFFGGESSIVFLPSEHVWRGYRDYREYRSDGEQSGTEIWVEMLGLQGYQYVA
jgi:hypothetical protein